MDIKQLKFLIALDQTRHFGQAAALCHVTQPTLSMRLRSLEEELDLVLVARGQRFEGFTEAGERILAWARTLLAAHDGLQAEAASCRGQVVGSLRLGTVPLASFDPTRLLVHLRARYPELHFQLSAHSTEQILEGLSRNQLDLGLCYLDQVDRQHFEVIELGMTTLGLLHDTRFFRFDQPELAWDELGDTPLGLLSKGMHYRQSLDLSLSNRGLAANIVLESDSTFQLLQAVTTGLCGAVMPLGCGLETLNEHLRLLPIVDAQIHSPMALLLRRSEPRSALAQQCFEDARLYLQAPAA